MVDGGDPSETLRIKGLGFVDGQTTNPTLIAKNPDVHKLIASGHRLSSEEEKQQYKKIVQAISPLVGDAGVSIEVFADVDTTAEDMVSQGKEMFTWIPNAYIKYRCTMQADLHFERIRNAMLLEGGPGQYIDTLARCKNQLDIKSIILASCSFPFSEKLLGYFCAKSLLKLCWWLGPRW